jgi:hypothetical protein
VSEIANGDDHLNVSLRNNLSKPSQLLQARQSLHVRDIGTVSRSLVTSEELKEKEMITRQLDLINTRRLELTRALRKGSIAIGTNANSLNTQQWDSITEYSNGTQQQPISLEVNLSSKIHLELSSSDTSGDADAEDDEGAQSERRSIISPSRRRPLYGKREPTMAGVETTDDNDEHTADEQQEDNKENIVNKLYPNLDEPRRSTSLGLKNRAPKTNEAKLYPSLNSLITTTRANQFYNNLDIDDKDSQLKSIELYQQQQPHHHHQEMNKIDDLSFLMASEKSSILGIHRERMIEAFFNEDDQQQQLASETFEENFSRPGTGLLKRTFNATCYGNLGGTFGFGSEINEPLKAKVSKTSPKLLTVIEVRQMLGNKTIKPKLLNRFLLHRAYQQQSQSALPVPSEPIPSQESYNRKLETLTLSGDLNQLVPSTSEHRLIKLNESVVNGYQACLADYGLFNARRYRSNWSVWPSAATHTRLSLTGSGSAFLNGVHLSSSFTVNETDIIRKSCEKYLQIQLKLSEFIRSPGNLRNAPLVRTKLGNQLIKSCCECTKEMKNTISMFEY